MSIDYQIYFAITEEGEVSLKTSTDGVELELPEVLISEISMLCLRQFTARHPE